MDTLKVFVIAGEPSGDALGGAVMEGLKDLVPGVTFAGVGGPLMATQGLESQFDMAELSLMGLVEILPKYRHLKRRIREVAAAVNAWQPDVLLTIDSPDFCFRVVDLVKAGPNPPRCVHYVAPTVWAWRAGRAAKLASRVDQVLALFPFEPPYFEAVGLRCDFVGHPIATAPQADSAEAKAFRDAHGAEADPFLLVLPGSRRGEITRLAPIFGEVVSRLSSKHPRLRAVVPAVPRQAALVRACVSAWSVPAKVIDSGDAALKRTAFASADLALAASGTVSLELAAADTPMVIAYDMAWLTRVIMQRMMTTDTVTLVNLVSETRVVPEFIGAACRPDLITQGVEDVLAATDTQRDAMQTTMTRLGLGGEAPGHRAARAILDGLGRAG